MSSSSFIPLCGVVKSPLDSNVYKAIRLCSNDLKVVMISNQDEQVDITGDRHEKATSAFQKILEFNKKNLNMDPCGEKSKKMKPEKNRKKTKACPDSRMCRGKAARGEEEKGVVIVSLAIGCGALNDPVEAPGLAHLCEHAIFCGSKNYPNLEAFQEFLSENGGEYNARTDAEYTTIFVRTFKESLEETLQILVDCVSQPIMDKATVMNELKAVEAEFSTRKMSDDIRIIGILQSCAKEGHPCGKFWDGNELSLNTPTVYDSLLKWKDRHYRGNYMSLVIKGPLPIDKMQSLIIKNFSGIPRGEAMSPAQSIAHHGTDPFIDDKWAKLYRVVPLDNQDMLKVTWYLEPKFWKDHKTKPLQYLHWLMEQKAEGGLVQYLKKKGWIFSLCASCPENGLYANNFVSGFTLQFILTNEGFNRYEDVLKALFAYIKLLTRDYANERLFGEFKILMADLFHYMSDRNLESPFGSEDAQYDGNFILIKEFSEILQIHDPKDLLLSKYLVSDFNKDIIAACLNKMTPLRANFILTSPDFGERCKLEDRWYGAKYCLEAPTFIGDLENVVIPPEMFLPEKNKYLDESLCYPLDYEEKIEIQNDRLILSTDKAKIYYLKSSCLQGYLPTAKYYLLFSSAEGNTLLQGKWAMIDILTKCLEQIIHLQLGTALNALINCDFFWEHSNSLELQIFGPSNKLPEILSIALQVISNLHQEITPQLFENMAELAMDNMATLLEEGEKFAEELQNTILYEKHISAPRHQQFLSRIRYDDFMEFCSLLQRRAHLYGELIGCVTKTQSKSISETIDSVNFLPWKGARWFCEVHQAIVLPIGERCLRVKAPNPHEANSVVKNHYQLGKLNAQQAIVFEVLLADLDNFVFENLRTVEGLGYIVDMSAEKYLSVDGLTISVITQADKFTTGYVDERIDATLMKHYQKYVHNQSDFNNSIKHRIKKEDKVSYCDVKQFYVNFLLAGGSNCRKISIQVVGYPTDAKASPKDTAEKNIQEKIQKYSSGPDSEEVVKAKVDPSFPYDFVLPDNLRKRNGYFVTDIQDFKNKQCTWGLDDNDSPYPSDTEEDDEDEETKKMCCNVNKNCNNNPCDRGWTVKRKAVSRL